MAEVSALRNLGINLNQRQGDPQRIPIYRNAPEYIDRANNPQNYPVINNPNGSISTHRMAAEVDGNGNWYVFPTVQMIDGILVEFNDSREAMEQAFKTGNILKAPSKQAALSYAEGGYKQGTNLSNYQPQKAGLQGKFQPIVSDNIVTPQEAVEVLESRGVEAAYLPFESSWSPFDPNFRSTVRSSLNDLLGGSNIASNSGYRRGRIADALAGLVDFAPAIGDAVGVGDTMTSYRQGDMLGTGINALATGVGVLPLVGGPASKAVKAGGNRVRSALNELGYGRTPNQSLNSIPFIHNTDPNTLKGSGKFGTSIEPAGQYVSPTDKLRTDFPENFIAGEKEFSKPLVINFGDGYDKPNNWKNRLSAEYDNKTGIDLTNALRADGYDGIVTVDEGGNLSEMVDLTQGKSGSALSGLELNIDDLDEDQYIQAINPQGTQIKPEARPNLGMGDMYGMASRNAEEIMTQELRSGETIRYVQDGDSVYALGYNPDLGEEDVVGYMLGGGDGSELAVVDQMQGKGIGGNLSYLYRSQNPMAQSGGFTEAGEAAARQAYRRIMGYE